MSGFLVWLGNALYPKAKPIEYHADILEAAELEDCDPKDIIWCSDCDAYHKAWW